MYEYSFRLGRKISGMPVFKEAVRSMISGVQGETMIILEISSFRPQVLITNKHYGYITNGEYIKQSIM